MLWPSSPAIPFLPRTSAITPGAVPRVVRHPTGSPAHPGQPECSEALATPEAHTSGGSWDETRHRLEHLTGEKTRAVPDLLRWDSSADELSKLRSVKLKRLVPGPAMAEFFILFGPGPKIEDVEFISGSEELKSAHQALSEAKFEVAFPEGGSAHIVRRAILTCSSDAGCSAVLLTPDAVNSVK